MSNPDWSRRRVLLAGGAFAISGYAAAAQVRGRDLGMRAGHVALEKIETASGGRIGVAALNLATGGKLYHRENERFAMCSTFKWVLAALVLRAVERDEESLSRLIYFVESDLVHYSPVTERFAGTGMTVDALCHAMMTTSDNTAANLLLATLGGPAGLTRGVRTWGDSITRLDRTEPGLNENRPNDPRDTSTPAAMASLLADVLFGADWLADSSRQQLGNWMIDNRTGKTRLRAGLGQNWLVGNRTGSSRNNQSNDVAFAIDQSQEGAVTGPLIIVSYANVENAMSAESNSIHERVAREVVRALG